jgi:5-oxoprolinase (ATP-hydrolysing)
MAEAIRKISIRQGQDPADYSLVCFGGAGGQHACALANLLQIHRIIIPYEAGLLSAFGIGNARVERVKERQILDELPAVAGLLDRYFDELTLEATKDLNEETGRRKIKVITSRKIYLRLKGQETSLALEYNGKDRLRAQFIREYKKLYGHWIRHRVIEVDSLRVITSAHTDNKTRPGRRKKKYYPQEERFTETYTNGRWARCPVFTWENLEAGAQITGPALILSENSTIFLEMGWHFNLDDNQNANLSLIRTYKHNKTTSHAAALELFTNRFTAVAEEMGTLLQRSSFSVNVKERLDFSCALLDAKGNLVVNAPHIPVHLGSLGVCVRSVIKTVKLRDGDVIITNHPAFGGSHLPDITLIKPIYYKQQLIAFVANRAHHAEIGGTKPGSMPADAHTLEEEGVVIRPRFLVKNGFPQWKELEKILTLARYPTRSLRENLADINGALAAVTLGETAVRNLCNKYGAGDVVYYMKSLRKYATDLMRQRIDSLGLSYRAQQRLDNGAKLKVDIAKRNNKLTIDFSGSAHVNSGNLNATIAIVNSVVLYTLRLLIDQPVPLNEGLLTPIKLIIPAGMLNPTFRNDDSKSPAVVGGNTEVSQRLTDTLLKALRLAACSQGTMNNLLFGNAEFGYYETIAGGVGAGPGFHGADAVHQHMTNTRITDPEILEHRYPVRLEKFEIRKGSGGRGKWRGGNGILRELYFKESLDVNLLSQHRVEAPYGMLGGDQGRVGSQYLIKGDNRQIHLDGISGFQVSSGDKLIIKTPGGGGWGKK